MTHLRRPRYVPLTDKRSPMRRFLEQTRDAQFSKAYVAYDQQYRTLWKAAELGLVSPGDDGLGYGGQLTEAGNAWLAKDCHR